MSIFKKKKPSVAETNEVELVYALQIGDEFYHLEDFVKFKMLKEKVYKQGRICGIGWDSTKGELVYIEGFSECLYIEDMESIEKIPIKVKKTLELSDFAD